MFDINRTVQELVSDYAGALRDGCVPVFLKSLTRQEAQRISSSKDFWYATEVVRILNGIGFAKKALSPNMGEFMSRVDANIISRLKKDIMVFLQQNHLFLLLPRIKLKV